MGNGRDVGRGRERLDIANNVASHEWNIDLAAFLFPKAQEPKSPKFLLKTDLQGAHTLSLSPHAHVQVLVHTQQKIILHNYVEQWSCTFLQQGL